MKDAAAEDAFWRAKPLEALSRAEWESLCDGCGKCCLVKLEDADTGAFHYTRVACRLFDPAARRCRDYPRRSARVPGCVTLTAANIHEVAPWMPATCAYRLLAEGADLPAWHPLVCGDRDGPVRAGVAVGAWTVPEYAVREADYEDHIIADGA